MCSVTQGTIFFALFCIVLVRDTTAKPNCSDGWFQVDGSCFKKYNSTRGITWDEANETCSSKTSSTLASVKSLKENDLLGKNLLSGGNSSWIGLRAEANSSLLLPNEEEPIFLLPEVKKVFVNRTCIATRATNIWTPRSCHKSHRYICKISRTSECQAGWQKFKNNTCLWISKTALNFTMAQQTCRVKGGKLADISTKDEYEFLRKQVYQDSAIIEAWFGLHKNATNYAHQQRLRIGPDYSLTEECGATEQNECCVTMTLAYTSNIWEEKPCESKLNHYVCMTEVNRAKNRENPLQVLKQTSSNKIHAAIGDTINLLCAANGESPITITWKRDKKIMQSYIEAKQPDKLISILSIKLANMTSYGVYICQIQDGFSNITRKMEITSLPEDSDEIQVVFVVVIVILAVIVAIFLIITIYLVKYIKSLKRNLNEAKKVDNVQLTNISTDREDNEKPENETRPKATNEYHVSPADENASYAALNRNIKDEEEEEHFYSPLQHEAPLYVNASEFKNSEQQN